MHVWNLLHAACENTGHKNDAKNRHLCIIAQPCLAISSQLRHVSTTGKKLVKWQYVLHMSSEYSELQPINGWDLLASLGHSSKFQRFSCFGFVTAATFLNRSRPKFALCLASLVYCIYIFSSSCPLTEFCPVQNSLYVQVLRSRILAALLHSIPAAGVSQTLRRGTKNGITELSQRVPPIFGMAAITLASAHILVALWRTSVLLCGYHSGWSGITPDTCWVSSVATG